MLSRNKIKWIKSLEQKKIRQQENCFAVEGEKMVLELLQSNFITLEIFALPDFLNSIEHTLIQNITCTIINNDDLVKISSLKTPNKVVAIAKIPDTVPQEVNFNCLAVALDHIQDPGNLGTIIRTANWFGVEYIVCSNDTVDAYNPKVIQSTMGAIFRTKIYYADILAHLVKAKQFNQSVYGAFLEGKNLFTEPLSKNGIIVLGNESKGISDPVQKLIDHKIRIPDFPEGASGMESLNVAIAGAIVLAEFRKR